MKNAIKNKLNVHKSTRPQVNNTIVNYNDHNLWEPITLIKKKKIEH